MTEMSMLDKMAKAWAEDFGYAWDQQECDGDMCMCVCCMMEGPSMEASRDGMRTAMRAVLQAMRDPTESMFEAGGLTPGVVSIEAYEVHEDGHVTADAEVTLYPGTVWQAMIDAALSGKSGMGEG